MGRGRQADVQFGRSRRKRAVAWPRGGSREDGGLKSALALVPQALGVLGGRQAEDQVMEEASATDQEG